VTHPSIAGIPLVLGGNVFGWTAKGDEGLAVLDASLERLRTDYLDLYYAHRDYEQLDVAQIVEAFDGAVRSGKVREIGASNFTAARLSAALEAADASGATPFTMLQNEYNLVARGSYGPELQELCTRRGIAMLPFFGLAAGYLTGKYRPGEQVPADSRAANKTMNRFIKQWLKPDVLEAVQALRPIADEAGITLSQLALAWVLHQPNITSVIIGATRPEQVHENIRAASVRLGDDVIAAVNDTLRTAAVL
jgi:aryl-alcohol dehydrogenase-like predicted oxidoreductase